LRRIRISEVSRVYSGGLGILAETLQVASDLRLHSSRWACSTARAIFSQIIDGEGNQIATYSDRNFEDLPIVPSLGEDGKEMQRCCRPAWTQGGRSRYGRRESVMSRCICSIRPGRKYARGSDIAHQLYGGDSNMRIMQENCLGVGGVRALCALG